MPVNDSCRHRVSFTAPLFRRIASTLLTNVSRLAQTKFVIEIYAHKVHSRDKPAEQGASPSG
ncbi:hypothetical protein BME24068_05861 [Burkholderia metallica]|nr:hypothetical protein BME24068_05861 [Burkholderia metallica]